MRKAWRTTSGPSQTCWGAAGGLQSAGLTFPPLVNLWICIVAAPGMMRHAVMMANPGSISYHMLSVLLDHAAQLYLQSDALWAASWREEANKMSNVLTTTWRSSVHFRGTAGFYSFVLITYQRKLMYGVERVFKCYICEIIIITILWHRNTTKPKSYMTLSYKLKTIKSIFFVERTQRYLYTGFISIILFK